jgi:hypothetical protein
MKNKLKCSRIWALPVIAAASVVLGLAGQASAAASTVPAPAPVVVSASATPGSLPSGGGVVMVTGTVESATDCQLKLLSGQSFPVVFSHNPRSCSTGAFSAQVTVGPNSTPVQRSIAFALVASKGASTAEGRFYVLLAGAQPSAIVSVGLMPPKLPAGGGVVAVTATVDHAASCQLQLLSKQSFPVVYSHNPKACSTGTFSANVTIGPNPTPVPRTVAFALTASVTSSHVNDPIYISVAAAPVAVKSGVPTTTNQLSVAAASAPPAMTKSSNWSGYSTNGGPFKVVKGTFTVPSVEPGSPSFAHVAEWVGVDGTSQADTSLIQAGVDEFTDPVNTAQFDIQAWWEILPAAETDITVVTVKPGDSVTVTLWQVTSSTWQINLTDNTDGESYTTPQEQYSGPGSSAEWIVEATTRCTFRCETTELAPYSPAVAFSGLGLTGAQGSLEEDTMEQQGAVVATPTALSSQGFSVAYTGQQQFGRPLTKTP